MKRFIMTGPTTVRIARRESFNAAHQLRDPHLTEAENLRLFGKCCNLHGHNYVLEVVVAGEVVEAWPEDHAPAVADAVDAPFSIAYEDDSLLVVAKPAGVVVHPARGHWTGTLAQALAAVRAIDPRVSRRSRIITRTTAPISGPWWEKTSSRDWRGSARSCTRRSAMRTSRTGR